MPVRRRTTALSAAVVVAAAAANPFAATPEQYRIFFNPDTLQCREEVDRVLPFTDYVIHRSPSPEYRWPVIDYLVSHGAWAPVPTPAQHWLEVSHTCRSWRDGDSHLDIELGGHGYDWATWTQQHPVLAAYFWPRLLARVRAGDPHAVWDTGGMFVAAQYSEDVKSYALLTSP